MKSAIKDTRQNLISIVVPVYNAEKFLKDTIATVLAQSYKNWELILVDDCSTDNSKIIIKNYAKLHTNISLYSMRSNSGVALARNKGVMKSQGRYIAFLDADDLWKSDKLEEQFSFMKVNRHAFTFTDYEFTNASGTPNGKRVRMPSKIDYQGALKETIIWTSTVMIDTDKVSKRHIQMPDLRYGEDAITWWHILTIVGHAYSINKVLSYYRRTPNTLSANKLMAAINKWHLYKRTGIPLPYRTYCYICSMLLALRKRI